MMHTAVLLGACVLAAPAAGATRNADPNPVRVHLPFDGTLAPGVGPRGKSARVVRADRLRFASGVRGQALVVGGKGSASIAYPGPHADPRQGTAAFWVQAQDWDSRQEVGTHFFRLLPDAHLYRYARAIDAMAFHCRFARYGRAASYGGHIELRQGRWTHVAVTWLDRVVCLYVDGRPVARHPLWEPMNRQRHGQGLGFGSTASDRHTLIDEFYLFGYPLGAAQIAVLAASSRDGSAPTLPAPEPVRVYATHYPGAHKVHVYVDVVDATMAGRVVGARVCAVASGSAPVTLGTIEPVRKRRAEAVLDLPESVPQGPVRIRADLVDGSGRPVGTGRSQPFDRRVYPWQKVEVGTGDEVIPPFTPLRVQAPSVFCWGREYRFGPDGWPSRIVTRDAQVLADPIRLVARLDGHDVPLSVTTPTDVTLAKPGVVEFRARSRAGDVPVSLHARIEYDGLVTYTLRLEPRGPVRVDRLYLDIPVRNEHAVLYNAVRDRNRLTNESGAVPGGPGKVWGSSAKKSLHVLGTFVPYVWLGDYDRGLCWMCDTDRAWSVPDDADAVELIRQGDVLTCRVHFFRKAKTIATPWQVVFGLQAGPPRPEPEGWRLGWGMQKTRVGWYACGTSSGQGYGPPLHMDKYVAFVSKWRKEHGCGFGLNMSVNEFRMADGPGSEVNRYFQLDWRPGFPSLVRNNFVAHTADTLMKQGLVEGLYCDVSAPRSTYNPGTGVGYVRDDGRAQAGYNLFAHRDFFKRLATVHHQRGGTYGLMVHMTDAMVMPAYCFWDAKHDNEWGRRRTKGRDYIDTFPLDEVAARSMSRQYGMAASWHTPSPGHGDDLGCLLLLHDIVGRVESMHDRTLPAKLAFGLNEPDAAFVGYWQVRASTSPSNARVYASAWVRRASKTALVTLANLGKADWQGTVSLPAATLGLGPDTVVADGEPGHYPRLPARVAQGRIELPLAVARHNYRFLLLGPKRGIPAEDRPSGSALPGPGHLLADLCDDFSGPKLSPAWQLTASKTAGGEITCYRGRLCVRGASYRFAAAQRALGQDDVSVQVRVEHNDLARQALVGLGLGWPSGAWALAAPDFRRKQFRYEVFVPGDRKGSPRSWQGALTLDRPGRVSQVGWVRIRLTAGAIVFHGSADGKTWTARWSVPRGDALRGAPATLRLGKNPAGREQRWCPKPTYVYFGDLVVGR